MPAVDYAAAWSELARLIASKPHHGSKDLLAEMTTIAASHEVAEDLMQRALRLQGGSYTIQLVPETGAKVEGGSSAPEMPSGPGSSHGNEKESHDEYEQRSDPPEPVQV